MKTVFLLTLIKRLTLIFPRKIDKSFSNITFLDQDIQKIIQNLNPNKAYGHDMIGAVIILWRLYLQTIEIILTPYSKTLCFPSELKKTNVDLAHKKDEKQLPKIYGPI